MTPVSSVCFLFPHLRLGGGETAMIEAANELKSILDVRVCALERGGEGQPFDLRAELNRRFDDVTLIPSAGALSHFLRSVDVLIWYGTNGWTPRALNDLPERPKSIRIVHTDKPEEGQLFCARWTDVIDAVVCVSPIVQRQIPGATWIPNTASLGRLRGTGGKPFGDSRRITVGYLGRLLSFKNIDWMIRHLKTLDCNLLVQGLDTEQWSGAALTALAERQGVAGQLKWIPPGSDVGTLLRSVDALMMFSRHEGFPMVVVEAGFTATPVIATPVGALPEVFADSILFVEWDGLVPSADSVRRCLKLANAGWGKRLQQATRELCAPQRVAAQYLEVINAL